MAANCCFFCHQQTTIYFSVHDYVIFMCLSHAQQWHELLTKHMLPITMYIIDSPIIFEYGNFDERLIKYNDPIDQIMTLFAECDIGLIAFDNQAKDLAELLDNMRIDTAKARLVKKKRRHSDDMQLDNSIAWNQKRQRIYEIFD